MSGLGEKEQGSAAETSGEPAQADEVLDWAPRSLAERGPWHYDEVPPQNAALASSSGDQGPDGIRDGETPATFLHQMRRADPAQEPAPPAGSPSFILLLTTTGSSTLPEIPYSYSCSAAR